jgi:hypothetical protein
MIFQSSNIRHSEGVMILFHLEKKIGVSVCIFTTRHKLTFYRVLRHIGEFDFGVAKSS